MKRVVTLESIMYHLDCDLTEAVESITGVEPHYRGEMLADALGKYITLGDFSSVGILEAEVRTANMEARTSHDKANLKIIELEGLVAKDPLTGLLNRRGFENEAGPIYLVEKRGGNPMSVLMVDGDYFKKINDNYGHDVGDTVLKYLADEFRSGVRESDSVARWGGEEFVILLPNTDLIRASKLGAKINNSIKSKRAPHGEFYTVSIGAAEVDMNHGDAMGAINEAIGESDKALYWVKVEGGRDGTAYFDGKEFRKV